MNPYGAVERSLARLGGTARSIMGDIASERVKVGQTELAREKMRYDITALQGKHKVEIAQIKATHKHREGVKGIQRTQMENQKQYQDKMLGLNRDRFNAEQDTLMTAEEAAGLLYFDLPEQQATAAQIIAGMSDKVRGIKLPGKEWAGILGEIKDAGRKDLEHEEKMGLLGYQTETAKLKRAKLEKGDKITISKVLPSGRVATKKVYPDKIPEGWDPYDRKGAVTKPEMTKSQGRKRISELVAKFQKIRSQGVAEADLTGMSSGTQAILSVFLGQKMSQKSIKQIEQAFDTEIAGIIEEAGLEKEYERQLNKAKLGSETKPTEYNFTQGKGLVPVK